MNQPIPPVPPTGPERDFWSPTQPQTPDVGWQAAPHGQSWQPVAGPSGIPGQQPQPSQWAAPASVTAPVGSASVGQSGGPWPPGAPPALGPMPGHHPWLPSAPAPKPATLPVEPREYHEFLRTPNLRWWRPVLALLMAAGLFFLASIVFTLPAMVYDISAGRTTLENYTSLDRFTMTPAFFLANNLALASCVPIAGLTQWACFGQRPRWISAVTGGFRWRWFGECVAWILPIFLASLVLDVVLGGLPQLELNANTGFMLAAILLTTPMQAAGEEYLLRGLGQRAVAAWLPRMAGLVVSTAVTAFVFMLLHGAGDPWLNVFYLFFAVVASILAWRTGGLEAAVAMHVVNNVVSMTFLPFTDFSDMFNRSEGAGSPVLLVQMTILLAALAVVLWRAKSRGLIVRAAPGAAAGPGVGGPPHQPQASPMPLPWRDDHGNQTG